MHLVTHLASSRSLFALALVVGLLGGAADVAAASPAGADVRVRAAVEESTFDRAAAAEVMGSIDVSACRRKKGPTGDGHVAVTFLPKGTVGAAVVDRPPFAGTKVGKCVAKIYRKARIPSFKGDKVVVGKTFHLE